MENEIYDWRGDERREAKRRDLIDRRGPERRKKYWWSMVLPTLIGIMGAAVISWGAYVTHTTYGISAKYESQFDQHIGRELQVEATNNHKLELMQMEYNDKMLILRKDMLILRKDMNEGFKEMRASQLDIYNLLLENRQGK
jgi:hypothetical protein